MKCIVAGKWMELRSVIREVIQKDRHHVFTLTCRIKPLKGIKVQGPEEEQEGRGRTENKEGFP